MSTISKDKVRLAKILRAIELNAYGETLASACREVGINPSAVRDYACRNGIELLTKKINFPTTLNRKQ